MQLRFVAQQKTLGLSECERLCGTWSQQIENLARESGLPVLIGTRLQAPVAAAINMSVRSIAGGHGVEPGSVGPWLPGLRNEALFRLGEVYSNWAYDGPSERQQEFWDLLYGRPEVVRPRVAGLLGCHSGTTTRRLRYFSQSDVEILTNAQLEAGLSDRIPLFSIDAHDLASRVRNSVSGPLFSVTATTSY